MRGRAIQPGLVVLFTVVSRACKLNLLDMVEFYCRCLFGFFGAGGGGGGNVFIRAFVYV